MKKVLIFVITLFFSVNSFAQESPKFSARQVDYILQAQSYMNKLEGLKANFIQFNPQDSSIANGELFLKRPGKFLLKYSKPFNIDYYILDGKFIQYDYDLDQVTRADASDSPLNILLYRGIDLRNNPLLLLTNVVEEDKFFTLYFVNKTENLSDEITGLTLKFSKLPIELTGIQRVDAQGNATELTFSSINSREKISDKIFKFKRPTMKYPGVK